MVDNSKNQQEFQKPPLILHVILMAVMITWVDNSKQRELGAGVGVGGGGGGGVMDNHKCVSMFCSLSH